MRSGAERSFQSMLPQVYELDLDKLRARRRNEHLAAVANRRQSGGPVDIAAEVPLLCEERRARVQPDPHLDRPGCQRLVHRLGGYKRTRRGREREEERVTLCVNLDSAPLCARLTDHPPVLG
jgi:hypothetical protein